MSESLPRVHGLKHRPTPRRRLGSAPAPGSDALCHTHFDVLKCTSCASCGKPLGTAALNNELLHALLLSLLAWSCSRGERDAFTHMQHERHHET